MITRSKAYQLRRMIEKSSASLSDNDAYGVPELFEAWAVGVLYKEGKRLRYGSKLYKVRQNHTSQADWTPDITSALYVEVEKPGQGDTPDNPIPYNNNMELFEGKYYSQSGVTYICIRSTGTAVYNNLADLVGLYVEVYTEVS